MCISRILSTRLLLTGRSITFLPQGYVSMLTRLATPKPSNTCLPWKKIPLPLPQSNPRAQNRAVPFRLRRRRISAGNFSPNRESPIPQGSGPVQSRAIQKMPRDLRSYTLNIFKQHRSPGQIEPSQRPTRKAGAGHKRFQETTERGRQVSSASSGACVVCW